MGFLSLSPHVFFEQIKARRAQLLRGSLSGPGKSGGRLQTLFTFGVLGLKLDASNSLSAKHFTVCIPYELIHIWVLIGASDRLFLRNLTSVYQLASY